MSLPHLLVSAPSVALVAAPATTAVATPGLLTDAGPFQIFGFWLFAVAAVMCSLLMITRRNAVVAAMWLVGALVSVAGLFLTLHAHFLGVIQVLVYAGAIMVLFVFVIMILNREDDELFSRGAPFKLLAGTALAFGLWRLVDAVWSLKDRMIEGAWAEGQGGFGTTKDVGRVLFSDYLFPFEVISLVLLVAVVGGLVHARPRHAPLSPNKWEDGR